MSKVKKQEKKSIFFIEDEVGITVPLKALLEDMGFFVEIIPRINSKLLNTIANKKPDLIFLDILLAGEDGRVFCRHLKENRETKMIPVVMMSAYPNAKESALKAGADQFIEKPFSVHELLEKVDYYLSSSNF